MRIYTITQLFDGRDLHHDRVVPRYILDCVMYFFYHSHLLRWNNWPPLVCFEDRWEYHVFRLLAVQILSTVIIIKLPTLRLLDGVSVFFISPKYPSAEIDISPSFEHRRKHVSFIFGTFAFALWLHAVILSLLRVRSGVLRCPRRGVRGVGIDLTYRPVCRRQGHRRVLGSYGQSEAYRTHAPHCRNWKLQPKWL